MLDTVEIRTLAAWCAARSIRWSPVSREHAAAVLLEPTDRNRCWQRMLLTVDHDDFELVTEAGEPLASASELHSVLDALEGGVAETAVMQAMPVWSIRTARAQTVYVV